LQEIACFVSPHGFGHATRTTAVIEALNNRTTNLYPHIFTTVPESLFAETLDTYSYHNIRTDIGLEQKSALEIDLKKTVSSLDQFLPFPSTFIQALADLCTNCSFILCDIAPLGIAVARELKIPSILVENFTWDWLYSPYPELRMHAEQLKHEFQKATFHIQTAPVCQKTENDLECGPIFRRCREDKESVRQRLDARARKIILITAGGIGQEFPIWEKMHEMDDFLFILLGQNKKKSTGKNILLLDQHTMFYHPDLISCADLVVCKSGYSTFAECFQTGTRIISIGRDNFPESRILLDFQQKYMVGLSIGQNEFFNGSWLERIDEALLLPSAKPAAENGADIVAAFLEPFLS